MATEFSTKNYEPLDYCIELSKMIHAQDKDEIKFDKLFTELYHLTGDDKYVADWMEDNDPLFIYFMRGTVELHKTHRIPVRIAMNMCYKAHCLLDKETFTSNEKYNSQQQRALHSLYGENGTEVAKPARKGLRSFFRRR